MHYVRHGSGKPLLLIHGIGSSHRLWYRIIDTLAAERNVIAVDLPGFGDTTPLTGEISIRTLVDTVTDFLHKNWFVGMDCWVRLCRSIRVVSGRAGRFHFSTTQFVYRSNLLMRCSPFYLS